MSKSVKVNLNNSEYTAKIKRVYDDDDENSNDWLLKLTLDCDAGKFTHYMMRSDFDALNEAVQKLDNSQQDSTGDTPTSPKKSCTYDTNDKASIHKTNFISLCRCQILISYARSTERRHRHDRSDP